MHMNPRESKKPWVLHLAIVGLVVGAFVHAEKNQPPICRALSEVEVNTVYTDVNHNPDGSSKIPALTFTASNPDHSSSSRTVNLPDGVEPPNADKIVVCKGGLLSGREPVSTDVYVSPSENPGKVEITAYNPKGEK